MSSAINFKTLADRTTRDAARATAARLYFSNAGVRRWLSRILASEPGDEHSFLADPLFEATFGWKSSGKQWKDLQGNLLSNSTIDALDYKSSGHRMDRDWSVFEHQLAALETLLAPEPRSLVVSSGTGSGKTECFLVPILESLARQVDTNNRPIEGVQALFLYPLNALINSQQERLSAWMSPFNGNIRYCLYNGETKPQAKETIPERVLSRSRLRESPPPVLLTNATMLEYMLVRSEDTPILEKSRGQLRWIVLDEAHTYIGSQAGELALLLRRVMIGFGVKPEDVRFVATSATIGGDETNSKNQLREFLADLAGVAVEQVVVVTGSRHVPQLPTPAAGDDDLAKDLSLLKKLPPAELYDQLLKSRLANFVRTKLAEKPTTAGSLQIAAVDKFGKISVPAWLELVTQFCRAVSSDDEAFLPVRIHYFHRTFDGLWACINDQCTGKAAEIEEDENWPWGSVHTHAIETCPHCQSLALELVRCGECGNEHLMCAEEYDRASGNISLVPRQLEEDIDEFKMDLDTDQWESANLDTADEIDDVDEDTQTVPVFGNDPRYLPARYSSKAELQKVCIDNKGQQNEAGPERTVLLPGEPGFRCALCNSGVTDRRPESLLFRSARAGMPFYSLIAGRNLLRTSPAPHELDNKVREALPADGRKILTFSDSRQGTARLAMSQQQDADRGFVRSQIYHQIAQANPAGANAAEVEELNKKIEALKVAADDNDAINEIRQGYLVDLRSLDSRVPVLSWLAVRDVVAKNKELVTGSKQYLSRISTLTDISAMDYANFCLYREFIRRPKKGSTLETLGLAALRYPTIEQMKSVPAEVAQRNIDLDEWKTILVLILNFVFRAGYAVDMPSDWERWLGERARTNVVRGPNQDRVKGTIGWPTSKYPHATIVKVLQKTLLLNLSDETDKQWLDSLFQNAWSAISGASPRLINNNGEGWQLLLSDAAEIYIPDTVWQCPFTGRAFNRVFRGTSPYIPVELDAENYPCLEIKMPTLPQPFWEPRGSEEPLDAEQWLETDQAVVDARHSLLWENHSDLVARYSGWYGTGEHSAQQDSKTLQVLTEEFNKGRVNILNCSTTMEMGVDIAGISAVMMNNAPPGPANYLQRAGRAGRRGETASAALTICSASAHGAMLFENPRWPFTAPVAVPRVSLESTDICQRHVNALLLSWYLRPIANPLRADCDWFYGSLNDESSHCDQFVAWLESTNTFTDELVAALNQLTQRTVLSSQPVELIVFATKASINRVRMEWLNVVSLLENDMSLLGADKAGDKVSPAARAVEFRLSRIREEYLLHELATEGFLPGYGFPTDVVSFVTTTIEDLKQKQKARSREDNRTRSRGYPSRDLPVALREYAPGANIAIDGRVYTSGGVLLNWHIPPGDKSSHEIQALKHYWSCGFCGGGGTTVQSPPEQCPTCGTEKPVTKRFIEPAGFAVELSYRPHNDTSQMLYMPYTTPRLHINDSPWCSLASRSAGRIRYSAAGIILHRNAGRNQLGYSICLRCGKAEEQTEAGEVAPVFTKPHWRLRGGKDLNGESTCEASHEDHSIIRDHELAHQSKTSIAELQFNDPLSGKPLSDSVVAWSLAVAMRYGLVQLLGLEQNEIGITIQESSSEGGSMTQSIMLFDTTSGGAGYAEHLINNLPIVMRSARELLDCRCETCCHNCLLSYDTQHEVSNLDRQAAIKFIDSGLLPLLSVPEDLRYFGESSITESLPLPHSLSSALNRVDTREVDIYLGGAANDWLLVEWDFLQRLIQYGSNGGKVRLIINGQVLEDLPASERRFLAALNYSKGIELFALAAAPDLENNGRLVAATRGADMETSWAVSAEESLAPGPDWGYFSSSLVKGRVSVSVKSGNLKRLPESYLTESDKTEPSGIVRLEVLDQLNVGVSDFGETLWQLIFDQASGLQKQFESAGAAASITYSDNYIKSPLCLRLLSELLVNTPSSVIGPKTNFNIVTVELKNRNSRGDRVPRYFHENWLLDNHRRAVANKLMSHLGWAGGAVDVLEHRSVPHYREITIKWSEEKKWSMQLDQGFGALNTINSVHFPFDQGVPQQAVEASQINSRLVARHQKFKTYFFFDGSI